MVVEGSKGAGCGFLRWSGIRIEGRRKDGGYKGATMGNVNVGVAAGDAVVGNVERGEGGVLMWKREVFLG